MDEVGEPSNGVAVCVRQRVCCCRETEEEAQPRFRTIKGMQVNEVDLTAGPILGGNASSRLQDRAHLRCPATWERKYATVRVVYKIICRPLLRPPPARQPKYFIAIKAVSVISQHLHAVPPTKLIAPFVLHSLISHCTLSLHTACTSQCNIFLPSSCLTSNSGHWRMNNFASCQNSQTQGGNVRRALNRNAGQGQFRHSFSVFCTFVGSCKNETSAKGKKTFKS